MSAVAVLGAGAWGTALAIHIARQGHAVELWARRADHAAALQETRENAQRLPGAPLSPGIQVTDRLRPTAPVVLLAVPAQAARQVCAALASTEAARADIVICCKGIERESGSLIGAVVRECLPRARAAVLTGPGFAAEVAAGLPTAVTLACADAETGRRLTALFGAETFRPYWTDDVIGAQIGGAVKNVMAIACGIAAGRGFGENTRAALITRGLAEMTRLAVALGGRAETLNGLSGIGDLALTCTSTQSRNYAFGTALGGGMPLAEALAARRAVVEGYASVPAVAALAARRDVDMPIVRAVEAVLHRGADLEATVHGLLTRPFRAEAEQVNRAATR